MRYNKKTLRDVDFKNKTAVVRLDLNVPIKDGIITDDKRITAALDTINYLIQNETKIVILSHLGRVKTLDDLKGKRSLEVVAKDLQNKLPNTVVKFCKENYSDKVVKEVKALNPGEILVLENTRYNDIDAKGNVVKLESKNDPKLAKFWASLGDVFVNDAFGTAHRAHASNVGIASNIKESCIGFLIEKELAMLDKACENPQKPLIAIIGGAKIADKIKTIDEISKNAEKILIGGAMAYPFQKAGGQKVGQSLCDDESVKLAYELLNKYGDKLVVSIDNIYADKIDQNAKTKNIVVGNNNFDQTWEGLDIGKKTIKLFTKILKNAKTVIWNGPMGYSEIDKFANGTNKICKYLAKISKKGAFVLLGGGDSAAAAKKLGYEDKFGHISTGGGASLAYLEGTSLPGIEAVNDKGNEVKEEPKKEEKKPAAKKPAKKATKKPAPKKVESKPTPKKEEKKLVSKKAVSKKTESKPVVKKEEPKKSEKKAAPKKEAAKKPTEKAPVNERAHQEIKSSDLVPYNFKSRRSLWKNKAGHLKETINCSSCKQARHSSILMDNKKHICYRCFIKKPN